MKKSISKLVMMIAIALSLSAVANAQISIKIRPNFTERERPVAPSRKHVWVSAEWNWNNGQYEHHDGYWAEPAGRNRRYQSGHWRNSRRGYTWVPGNWRR